MSRLEMAYWQYKSPDFIEVQERETESGTGSGTEEIWTAAALVERIAIDL